MKRFLLLFTVMAGTSMYSQMAVVDATTSAQLIKMNTTTAGTYSKMAEQVMTASQQLSQLEKTYNTVKETAEKVEKVNSAVKDYGDIKKFIEKQREIINNISIVSRSKNGNISQKKLESVLTTSSESISNIQSYLSDNLFNLNDKERIELVDKEQRKLDINLVRSRIYAKSVQ